MTYRHFTNLRLVQGQDYLEIREGDIARLPLDGTPAGADTLRGLAGVHSKRQKGQEGLQQDPSMDAEQENMELEVSAVTMHEVEAEDDERFVEERTPRGRLVKAIRSVRLKNNQSKPLEGTSRVQRPICGSNKAKTWPGKERV